MHQVMEPPVLEFRVFHQKTSPSSHALILCYSCSCLQIVKDTKYFVKDYGGPFRVPLPALADPRTGVPLRLQCQVWVVQAFGCSHRGVCQQNGVYT